MIDKRTLENSFFGAWRSIALCVAFFSVVGLQNEAYSQTLIVNEVSNGPAGNQEYMELVVVSQTAYYDCGVSTPPCIDIRGWIIDDNSGYHGTSGVAPGAVRFSFDPMWQCVPLGTIILIYNNGDPNTSLPPQDLSMTDGNCAIVTPISNTALFETNTTTPGAIACSYPAGGWTAGGNWSSTVIANAGDCVRLVDLSGCEVFSLCNGSANLNNMIYFTGSGTDDVWYFNDGNPFQQANWSEGCADITTCGSNLQTPGTPNNATNAAYIAQFNNGCQTITPISVSATSTIDNCNCSGTASATASGSIPGYTYAWYNATFQAIGQTSATATGLCSGTYYVIASSSIDCADTAMVVVGQNSPATVSVNSDVICSGSSTTLTATASPAGGIFNWSPTNETTTSISVSPLSTSTYVVSYTSLGCTVTAVSTVNVNAAPTVNAGTDISVCAGQFASLSGAIGAFASSSLWSTPTGSVVDASSLTTNFDPGIPSGTITLTLTTNDPNGPCPASSDQVIVTVNALPTVNAGSDLVVCPAQTATLTATGANTYSWSPLVQNGVPFTPTADGTYTVTGTSTEGCINTDQVLVTLGTTPTIIANDVTACSNGNVVLTASGASTYSWSPATNLSSTTGASVTFTAGTTTSYTVSGTSATGCVGTDQATVTVSAAPAVNAGNDVSICAGQSTVLTATGATSYQWTGLAAGNGISVSPTVTTTFTVSATGASGCASTDQVVVTVNALPVVNGGPNINACPNTPITITATGANTYSWNPSIQNGVAFTPTTTMNYLVTGTSAQGCTGTDFVLVTLLPAFTISTPPVSVCQNLTANLVATGALSYSWSPATNLSATTGGTVTFTPGTNTNYTVTGTNAAGCTATSSLIVTVKALPLVNAGFDATICAGQSSVLSATGANGYQWTGLAAGNPITVTPSATTTYTVTGTAANLCTNTDQILITVNPLPIVNGGADVTVCPLAQVTLTASGATTYSWNPLVQNGIAFTPTTTTNFQVTGTSNLGCTATDLVLVTILPAPSLSTPNVATCQNGTVNVLATGAQSYTWSPATNLSGITGGTLLFTAGNTTTYTIVGTSANGCTASSNLVVTVNTLPATSAGTDVSICAGQSTTLTASGANTYTWTGAAGNPITVSPAATTSYTVTGTSAAGCTNADQVIVTVNPLPSVNAGADVTVCSGQAVTLTATGTSTYSWNPIISNGVSFNPTSTATYVVTGTSALGCTATDNVLVTVNPIPVVVVNDAALCVGGTVALTASGATTYAWSPATNLSATTGANLTFTAGSTTSYTITGTSAAGCVGTDNATVTVNALPAVNAGADQTLCEGNQITLTATGGTTYSWNPAVTNGTVFTPPLGTTLYTVTGTNANGCIATDQVSVLVNANPIVNAGTDLSLCLGEQATLTATGAVTYSWSGSVVDGTPFAPAATNTYTVTGTSVAGCTATDALILTVNPLPNVNGGIDIETCAGQSVTLAGSGAATYTWDGGAANNQPFLPPTGTTVYTVTGTSAAGCVDTDQVSVLVNPNYQATFVPSTTFGCAPVSVTLYNTTAGGSIDCSWTLGNGVTLQGCDSVSFIVESAGCLDVTLSVNAANGCSSTVTQADLICVEETPVAEFAALPNVITVFDPPVQFLNTSSGGAQYIWDFGDGSPLLEANDPTHNYSQDSVGAYLVTLLATSPSGCTDTAYALIQIIDDVIFYVPNSFTPDGDVVNQTFQPVFTSGFDPAEYSMRIFNRWGEVVFETNDAAIGWDGGYGNGSNYKMMQDGTYTWKIEFTVLQTDERIMKVGHVNLLR